MQSVGFGKDFLSFPFPTLKNNRGCTQVGTLVRDLCNLKTQGAAAHREGDPVGVCVCSPAMGAAPVPCQAAERGVGNRGVEALGVPEHTWGEG